MGEINFNSEISALEAQVQNDQLQRSNLLRETFIVWYILNEGYKCEDFSERDLQNILKRNFRLIRGKYADDAELNFILGWTLNISFWHYDTAFESLGNQLIYNCYRQNSGNLLYKWAARDLLNLSSLEIKQIVSTLVLQLDKFVSDDFVKEYFASILQA